jgi:hypothetical protein
MARLRLAAPLAVSALLALAACAPEGVAPQYAQGYDDGCLSSSIYPGVAPGKWGFDTTALDTSADYRAGVRAGMDDCGFIPTDKTTLGDYLPLPFADRFVAGD